MTVPMQKSSPLWVDFHCHVDLYNDHEALIAECDRERVATLAVTTTPKAWPRNRELTQRSPYVRVGLGLHPQLVAERAGELPLFERYLPDARYVGEIGLDAGPRFYSSFEAQERVFERILRACAEQGDKILSIHSVRTAGKVLGHLERALPPERGRVILHWFTGSAAEARRAVEMGCYFSVNEEMLRSPKHRKLVASLPLDHLLTETDGPFVHRDGSPIRPSQVALAVGEIAVVHGLTAEQTAKAILQNLKRLVTA
ncbi:Qat anti-phage system TatD family nuclease QatD [Pseudomonas aeruginosa]|uniref:Qat anti-phage system TatD family nuclease QatD n=2 Tax=Pseudomonas aeruginosa TaxID=287 RepID=UPI00071B2BB4|nr:Qat anti-phage system TatD family nuclease QatD [Pseudomonas aeruginosa]KAB0710984.1 TatD family deoxyribonuclease [Pseudomonas aeruginosa]KSP17366.1 hydrolase TatD [Pseudomonas aeruginosa]MCW5490443.1 TatD family hydrolase [Pseudomonas aeruginosa]MQH00371.1 TatD family deoxyribonuclease [Pseudomonas aeruginosa]NPY71872.1 TatD family hydrolase [Pseudomonas aeruginosa]